MHFSMSSVQDFFYRALNLSASDNKMHTVPGGIIDATKVVLSKTWLSWVINGWCHRNGKKGEGHLDGLKLHCLPFCSPI